jgi:hypothetical protein
MPNLSIYLSNSQLDKAKQICEGNNCGLSDLFQAFIEGRVSLEELKAEKPETVAQTTVSAQDEEVVDDLDDEVEDDLDEDK